MKLWWLIPLALPLMAASPRPHFTLGAPGAALPYEAPTPGTVPGSPIYEPAPLPNPDAVGPPVASGGATTLSPTLFTQREQYRGDGFSPGSTAQGEQERNVQPAAGFKLHMPLQPN